MLRKLAITGVVIAIAAAVVVGASWRWLSVNSIDVPATVPATVVLGPDIDPQLGAQASNLLEQLRDELAVPAIQASVRIGATEVFGFASGYARLEPRTPVAASHVFPIASISKSVTGVIAARLAATGRLDLDAPIGDYLAGLPADKATITSRQLLSHQGGIRHYGFDFNPPYFTDSIGREHYDTVSDSLERFVDDPLAFEPGTGFLYSTYGYTLLSAVLESASGQSFGQLLNDEIVVPAVLPDLALDPGPVAEGRVGGHVDNPASGYRVLLLAEPSVSWKWAGGGMVASAAGLTQFARAVLDGTLLDPEMREIVFTPIAGALADDEPPRYALGWYNDTRERVAPDGRRYRAIHHGGTAFGAQSYLIMLPEADISLAVLINVYVGGSEAVVPTAVDVLDLFLPIAENRLAEDQS